MLAQEAKEDEGEWVYQELQDYLSPCSTLESQEIFDKYFKGIKKIKEEQVRSDIWVIYYLPIVDKFVRTDGYWSSYSEASDWSVPYIVTPQQKTIVVYEQPKLHSESISDNELLDYLKQKVSPEQLYNFHKRNEPQWTDDLVYLKDIKVVSVNTHLDDSYGATEEVAIVFELPAVKRFIKIQGNLDSYDMYEDWYGFKIVHPVEQTIIKYQENK
jgi:hypothetical protein